MDELLAVVADCRSRECLEEQYGLYRQCVDQAVRAEIQALVRRCIRAGKIPPCVSPVHANILKALQSEAPEPSKRGPTARFEPSNRWFVTVNPPPQVDITQVVDKLSLSLRKAKWVKYSEWVVEQRSEDPMAPHGWHVHICVLTATVMQHRIVIDKVVQMLRDFVQRASVDVKPLEERHYKYIRGQKQTEKLPGVEANKVLRPQYGFQDLYGEFPWVEVFPNAAFDP